jgi:hypothetical protein
MSRAYSAMVRSEENLPRLAVSSTAIFIHRYSGPCRITSVTSHKWAAVLYSSSSNTNKAKKGRLRWAESAGAQGRPRPLAPGTWRTRRSRGLRKSSPSEA